MSIIHLTRSDYVVIFGYFALVLLIGLFFRRQQKTAQDFFAGGHQVSWWLAGISHYMSGFSAFTFVVYSEIAYRYGAVAIVLFWTSVPACILGGKLFAARWRRARIITPVEFLEERCSLTVRQLFAWSAIPAKIFEDALKIFTTALFLSAGVGIGIKSSILACGLIVVVYTLLGGLLALVVTDYLQFLMKALAILLLLPLAVWRLGGLRMTLHSIPANLLHAHGGPYGWVYIASYALIVGISYNGNWSFAQKYYSVPDERSGQKAAYLSAFLNFIGTPIMLLPALMARSLMPTFAAQQKPQDVYVHLIFELLPAGMIGIIVAALFSATMATVSADLNAIAGVLTKDFYQRILRPSASETSLVAAGRSLTLLLGVMIIGISIWIAQSGRDSLFHIMVTAFGVLLAPTLLPLLATLVFRGLSSSGVITGLCSGMLCGVATLTAKTFYLAKIGSSATQALDFRLEGFSIFANIGVTCLGMYLGSVLFKRSAAEETRTTAFFRRLDTPISAEESCVTRAQSDASDFIIRLSTLAVGVLLLVSGALSTSTAAHWIDSGIGLTFLLLATPFREMARRWKGVNPHESVTDLRS
jgi:solute:Na+ symporter, SSS family